MRRAHRLSGRVTRPPQPKRKVHIVVTVSVEQSRPDDYLYVEYHAERPTKVMANGVAEQVRNAIEHMGFQRKRHGLEVREL